MTPATWPRSDALEGRLLWLEPRTGKMADAQVRDLARMLRPGDLLVVNDAATLPASYCASWPGHDPVEVRLAGPACAGRWRLVLFGAGDWRQGTGERPAPPRPAIGDVLTLGEGLTATIEQVSPVSPRLVEVEFNVEGAQLWSLLYSHGKPVQYRYADDELAAWHVQTPFGGRPWAVEMPSAGRPLQWALLLALKRAGVRLATVTHAAGLSATGDPALDRALPLPERFEVPAATVEAIAATRGAGGRIVAVGTSVVRALESANVLGGGRLVAVCGETDLRIGPGFVPRVADGILTGMHESGESHYDLLEAFAPAALLNRATAHAESAGYVGHEFGDSTLILAA
ncbi:MAG: S-adenosylmethionine:tRNA ribosyltransferase-isomerase [Candidatus Wallbacteria bacterium]|nr:S-adenosylmethionine:tRNA ribosyltransferase-isomerase [Candidatus Wallbacteria bacterium]